MQPVGGHQELHCRHLGQLLAGEDQRHRLGVGRQPLENRHGLGGGRFGQDLVVESEAAAKVTAERLQHRLVLIHHQQHRQSHAHLPHDSPSPT
jgi:hypothetical protein